MSGYPNEPGCQAHSETSIEAAHSFDAKTLRDKIERFVWNQRSRGATIDQVAISFGLQTGTASARVRELEMKNKIIKSAGKRKTRKKVNAAVYIHNMRWMPWFDRAERKEATEMDRLRNENRKLKEQVKSLEDALNKSSTN